ncbi:MAG: four helix bundle protein [Bacteroidetes bacterium]|nr:MAG: four helix bundle protein [Bacteroidota bacterium]
MSTFNKFEDIIAWQKATELCKFINVLTEYQSFSKDFKLISQIKGSSGSAMDNIAEGFERNGNREFIQFLSIAKASAGETRSQIYRIYDNNYIEQDKMQELVTEYEKLSIKIHNFINYLNKNEFKGTKFMDK